MTRDVKVGLLLGLAFIFMIAFIINGLPSFRGDSNELTTTMVDLPNNPPGIGAKEREFINRTESIVKQPFVVQNPPMDDPDIRFKTPLPQNPVTLKGSDKVKPVALGPVDDEKTKTVKPALPKIYVVSEDDNLALIAKKFYGPEEGNKRKNIMRIFEANRNILESPDEIDVGQKLIIPPLPASAAEKDKSKGIFSSSVFEKVKSIGREHLSLKKPARAKQGKSYTVREDDNLWKIAVEQLGDGSRYTEIARLNADILDDEDFVPVGTRLKIPAR